MKRIEIEFESVAKNIRKNKREMLFIFVGILLGGAVCGYIDYQTYEQEVYTVEDTIVQKADLEHLKKDETYYYQAFMELKEKSCGLNAYIQYLKQVNLSGQNMKKVSELETAALEEQKKFAEIQEFYVSEKPIIFDDLEAVRGFAKRKLETGKRKKENAETAIQEVEKSFTKNFQQEEQKRALRLKIYASEEVGIWEDYLEKMEDLDLYELQKTNSKMDLLLEEEVKSINALVERFNNLIADIEREEQYEVVYNLQMLREYCNMAGIVGELCKEDAVEVKKDEALIYARSIAGLDSQEERVCSILTFSALLGVAFSLLYGSLKSIEVC